MNTLYLQDVEIRQSKDGSPTLINNIFNEPYHSVRGALNESLHVFIQAGLIPTYLQNKKAKVLEIGFGTGLNALLSIEHALNNQYPLLYHTLEPYPIDWEVIQKIALPEKINKPALHNIFTQIHQAKKDTAIKVAPNITLYKWQRKLEEFTANETFQLIYFDAFSPKTQPELWHITMLQKCFSLLGEGGVFVTYCAKGQVKRDLKTIGFQVETLQGANGKREMIRATK